MDGEYRADISMPLLVQREMVPVKNDPVSSGVVSHVS